jgi:H+/Cl- antiporter ClcA
MEERRTLRTYAAAAATALVIGGAAGTAASLFLLLLEGAVTLAARIPVKVYLLPAALFLSRSIILFALKGTEETQQLPGSAHLAAIYAASARRTRRLLRVKLTAAIITIAFGGSAGRAGPSAQVGAAVSRRAAELLHLTGRDRSTAMICGVSAGFAAVLQAPAAAAVLTLEILKPGGRRLSYLPLAFLAALPARAVAGLLPLTSHALPLSLRYSLMLMIQTAAGGILFSLAGLLLMLALHGAERAFAAVPLPLPLKAALGGVLLLILAALTSDACLGLGKEQIDMMLAGGIVHPLDWLTKTAATAITLGAGGTGGVISPVFYVGTAAGSAYSSLIGADAGLFAALGLVSVLSCSANAPIAAVLLAGELFGPAIMPAAAVSCGISYLLTRHRRFPESLLLYAKHRSFTV